MMVIEKINKEEKKEEAEWQEVDIHCDSQGCDPSL